MIDRFILTNWQQFTSTQSIFVLSAGPVNLTATFLSSVEVCFVPPDVYTLFHGFPSM